MPSGGRGAGRGPRATPLSLSRYRFPPGARPEQVVRKASASLVAAFEDVREGCRAPGAVWPAGGGWFEDDGAAALARMFSKQQRRCGKKNYSHGSLDIDRRATKRAGGTRF